MKNLSLILVGATLLTDAAGIRNKIGYKAKQRWKK